MSAQKGSRMPYLLKTEPGSYSVDDLARDGETVWDGVTNAQAVKMLAGMKRGEMLVIYHTGTERRTVGLGKVLNVDAGDPKKPVIRLKFVKKTKTPRTLQQIKSQSLFTRSPLITQGRLSVVPLRAAKYAWRVSE
jgi:predicted RNA-binding protein with PUA-like domain